MSKQTEIILSGVGGQGLILCGTLLGEAATLYDGKRATLTSEYGVETRGTFAKSDVIVSEGEIYFPDATDPDLVLCLAQVAYGRYAGTLPSKTLLVYDSNQVKPDYRVPNQLPVPFTDMARELGNAATANIIAMGVVSARTGLVTPGAARQAISRFFSGKSERVVAMNHRAFDLGFELGQI